jgi:hypothetical protein
MDGRTEAGMPTPMEAWAWLWRRGVDTKPEVDGWFEQQRVGTSFAGFLCSEPYLGFIVDHMDCGMSGCDSDGS